MRQLGSASGQATAPALVGGAASTVKQAVLAGAKCVKNGSRCPPPSPHSLVEGSRQHTQSIRAEGQAFYRGVVSLHHARLLGG